MKYIDAKLTSINGELHISWQTEDNNWQAATTYAVDTEIAQDAAKLKKWVQDYKDAYNLGKDTEAEEASMPNIPSQVISLYNQPLNLT